jgi:hypothetical protein
MSGKNRQRRFLLSYRSELSHVTSDECAYWLPRLTMALYTCDSAHYILMEVSICRTIPMVTSSVIGTPSTIIDCLKVSSAIRWS